MTLFTGALPAQFGLRTSGVLDIQTRTDAFNNTGSVGVYGGSRGTFTPSFEYGGTAGQTQYFLSGRFFESNIGLENPTPQRRHPRPHDAGAGISVCLDHARPHQPPDLHGGVSNGAFQIPNTPGQTPNFTAFGVSNFNSALLNENQFESTSSTFLPTRNRSTASTCNCPISTATASCTSFPTRSAISSSTAWRRTSFVRASSTAFRRHRLAPQRCAYAAVRIFRERRALSGQQHIDRAATRPIRRSRRRQSDRCAIHRRRSQRQDRLADRHLSAGRMEDHQPADPERRLALRPDVPICRCQSVQPARQPDLEAVRRHHLPCRLRAHLHAAAAGAGRADQSRACSPPTPPQTRKLPRCR